MELFDVEPLGLAQPLRFRDALTRTHSIAIAVAGLIALRLAMAAALPLSFDEAYYWLWSKHLATGYYDHPPAIAFAIRLGTLVFGDTSLGVRIVAVLASAVASLAVWRTGAILLGREEAGATACLFFNLALMTNAETMTATPDALLMLAAALFVWALAKLMETGKASWWLAIGAAGGFALVSKYTAAFLGVGALAWLLFTPEGRRWIATPWPYLGAALALLLFAPVILWNANHDWISFRFQFGRTGAGHFAPYFLGDFLAGQIALATPFIFVLGVLGLAQGKGKNARLLMALIAPSLLFFAEHALYARVQGNWPSYLYPAFAIAAAGAAHAARNQGWTEKLARVAKAGAVPMALFILAVAYGQALTGFLPMRDPTANLLAGGFGPVAEQIDAIREGQGAGGVLATNYAPTGWLAFYLAKTTPVIQTNESYRWLAAPKPDAALLKKPLLYVSEPRRDESATLKGDFRHVVRLAQIPRTRDGRIVSRYNVYLVSGWRGRSIGRITNAP